MRDLRNVILEVSRVFINLIEMDQEDLDRRRFRPLTGSDSNVVNGQIDKCLV